MEKAAVGPEASNPSPCPLCLGTESEVWTTARDVEYHVTEELFTFRRCTHCDVLYIDPMWHDQLERIYPPHYYSFAGKQSLVQKLKSRLDARRFRAVLRRIAGESLSVLDVGGGTGWLLDVVRQVDPRVRLTQVVDLDAQAGAIAHQHGHRYFQGRIEDFSCAEPFDLVLLLNLIEHVPDPSAVLQHVRQLLSSGGLAIVQTPNFDSLDGRWFRHRNWGGYHCPRHFVLFTLPSFQRLVQAAGLQVVRSEYTQGGSFWSISILAALARSGLIRVDSRCSIFQHPLYAPLGAAFAIFDSLRMKCGARASQMTFWLAREAT